ncbi:hypothetical protein [Lyngbya confervoides]|uniref:Uncharacterized protein n=1 Tax=Lyngbya confervoides BDU141951 TaxID=1574623 RepID=A0ABD4T2R0_9CYAN|nr:hypothetical protein [Lyngbya confervoides]MCM1982895.1 hypothetical protein [Lyngbya confervoides BDU141951]
MGHVTPESPERQSVLDSASRVGLHFSLHDSYDLLNQNCPDPQIPRYLWEAAQHIMSRRAQWGGQPAGQPRTRL